jgi:peptide chain release factor 2
MGESGFWDNQETSSSVVKQVKALKVVIEPYEQAEKKLADLTELTALVTEDETEMVAEVEKDLGVLTAAVSALEFKTLMSGESDKNSAILSINAGAGGTESCDWVSMLYRMYSRWAEIRGFD